MLGNYPDFNVYRLTKNWGTIHTDSGERQSTPADVVLLFERLYWHQILSDSSRSELLSIMRTTAVDRDLPALVQGLPEGVRPYMADKNGMVYEDTLNVIADAGYFENDTCAFAIMVVTNKIDPAHKGRINEIIAEIAASAYKNNCRQAN